MPSAFAKLPARCIVLVRLLVLWLLFAPPTSMAQVPCQECWNDTCKEFKGLIPKCAAAKAPKAPPREAPPAAPPPAPLTPCLNLAECNGRCSAGESTACVTLGSMYENAIGVPEDREKALFWYRVGCDAGASQGCLRQKQVEAVLQKERAELEARDREAKAVRDAADRAAAEARAREEAEQRRKAAELRAQDEERVRRLCAASPPFHAPVQRTVPVRVEDQVIDPARCGTPGPLQYTVPLELEFDEELTVRVNRDCDALTCTLKRPDGQVVRLDEGALRAVQLGRGRSELTFSGGFVGPIAVELARVTRCDPARDALPMLKQGEPLALRDAQATCQFEGSVAHLFELERGSLAELERGRDDWREFGQRSVELTVTDAEGSRAAPGAMPIFFRLHRLTAQPEASRLAPPTAQRDGRGTRFQVTRAQLLGDEDGFVNPYRVFVAIPSAGPQAVRRVDYRAPFVMSAALHAQVAALAATDFSFASGGISGGIGLGWQVTSFLGIDFLGLLSLRGNDLGLLFTGSPLMIGVRYGGARGSGHPAGWVRALGGPVLRYGTASNYTSTQPLGLGLRLDVRPFNAVPLFAGVQLDVFELEPAAVLLNLGLAL